MFFNICFLLSIISTSKDVLFDKLLIEIKAKIIPDKLIIELEKSDVTGLQDSEEAYLILASMLFCKAVYQKSEISYYQVKTFVMDSITAWGLVIISDKLMGLNVSKFLQLSIAKRCKLSNLDSAYETKMNIFKKKISECRFYLGTNFPSVSTEPAEKGIQTKYFEKITVNEDTTLKMYTTFKTSKLPDFRYSIPFDSDLKSFSLDVSFDIPKDTIISEVNSQGVKSKEEFRLTKDTNVKIKDLKLYNCEIKPKENEHLNLVRASQQNQKLEFKNYPSTHSKFCVENGIQLVPKFKTVFKAYKNRYNNKDNFCFPSLSYEKAYSLVAVEHFVSGQILEESLKKEYYMFDASAASSDDISNGWAIISVDMNDIEHTNFFNNHSNALTQSLTISNVGSNPLIFEDKTPFEVVVYDPYEHKKEDYFEYTKIDPIEDSSDSTPVQPTPPSSPAQTSTVMIIVSCLIGLAVLLGIGYYLYTKKNNNN